MNDPLMDADDDAATPLTPEERHDLIPAYIATRDELNEAEEIGIAATDQWAFSRKRDVLDEAFLLQLHKRMFKDVWRWAGALRTTARNIGIDAIQISMALRMLVDDVRFWIEHRTFSPDEIALRFHTRLTYIHPFTNGNGRHARLAADLLITQLGGKRFSWGGGALVDPTELRARYIAAVRRGDGEDFGPLLEFARS